ncbi:hypothetical protein ACHAXN_003158 [Cyclotella atomus]
MKASKPLFVAIILTVNNIAAGFQQFIAAARSLNNNSASLAAAMSTTFYRRQLPETVVSFSSNEGRSIFASAMATGGTRAFFALIEQLQTQPEPAYCGLTTLVIVLNALAVDPRRLWKGPWRWYEESMLNCCVDLEEVKETGISFDTFVCLAKCQGLGVDATRASDSSLDDFRQAVKQICTDQTTSSCAHPTSFLIVSYTRKVLRQTGTGHFSPIGAYDEASDSVLLLDTARFKYGPHWVKLDLLFDALIPLDPSTGKSRGYMILSYDGVEQDCCDRNKHLSHLPLSIMFRPKNCSSSVKKYKQFVEEKRKSADNGEIDVKSVISYWTRDYTNSTFVRELIQPQLRPVDVKEIAMVESMQDLIKTMIRATDASLLDTNLTSNGMSCDLSTPTKNNECCNSSTRSLSQRYIQVGPIESLFIVYLASLSSKARENVFKGTKHDSTVLELLMGEVALISYAIETS